jgi:hypothetical protein
MPKREPATTRGPVRPIVNSAAQSSPKKFEDRLDVIDEFGRISVQLEKLRRLEKRQEQLRAKIQSWYAQAAAAESFSIEGREYSIEVGPCSLKRMIPDLSALAERLGEKDFYCICNVSLEKLDCYLSLNDQKPFVVSDRSGPRPVKAIAKCNELLAKS